MQGGVLDAVSAELLGSVESFVSFFDHLRHRSGVARVEHGQAGAEGEYSKRVGRVGNGEPFQACSHALYPHGRQGEGLFGEDAQELFTAVTVERVSVTSFIPEVVCDRFRGSGRRLGDRRCRCKDLK